MFPYKTLQLMLLAILLTACGGSGGGNGDPSPTNRFIVSGSAGPGGVIGPSSASVKQGETTGLAVMPDAGFAIDNVTGCNGSLSGNNYITGPITADCTVMASFIIASPSTAATPTLTFEQVKNFRFSWVDVNDATHYKLLENPDGLSGFTQTGSDIPQGTQGTDHIVPLPKRLNAQYILQSCNATGCTDSATLSVSGTLVASIGYFKASNAQSGDNFGIAVALSGDGTTLAVGANGESSNATGIDGNQNDNGESSSGAVYVFARTGTVWSQQAYLKASNTGMLDEFGIALALSGDGNTLAVGAYGESSTATGIGDQTNNGAGDSGAVYLFARTGSVWSQQAYVKASNTEHADYFGSALTLSGDGNTLAVGAYGESSTATGIGGNQNNNLGINNGAVYVFTRTGTVWSQQAYVKASNSEQDDDFGLALALSGDGNTLAVGASGEDSSATGINGNQNNGMQTESGAVYVFTRTGTVWGQQAYVKASNAEGGDYFGLALALSGDGNTLAVGALFEEGGSGAVYVFTRIGTVWSQQAYVKASNTGQPDQFGSALTLSGDGNTLAVGASGEESSATGIDGNQNDNGEFSSGAVYVFTRIGTVWNQQAYVKASNTGQGDYFGSALALSGDGNTLAVGTEDEDSNALGIGGNQTNNGASTSGAVYLY